MGDGHPGHTPHHTSYVLQEQGTVAAVFTGGSLLIGSVGRPDLVEPRLTDQLARAQHASARRLAAELPDETPVLPTHGFGSFCSSSQSEGDATTIGKEKTTNDALVKDVDSFVAALLAGLEDVPAYYAHMGPANSDGPAPVDLTAPRWPTPPTSPNAWPPGSGWWTCATGSRLPRATSRDRSTSRRRGRSPPTSPG